MLNQITIMGRMTSDASLRTTNSGTIVTSFSVAVERPFQKADAEKITDYIDVVAWRGLAEFVVKYFGKGRMICVQGSLQTRKYTDKNGQNRVAYEILAEHVHFTGEKKEAQNGAQSARTAHEPIVEMPGASAPYSDYGEIELDDSGDLPF